MVSHYKWSKQFFGFSPGQWIFNSIFIMTCLFSLSGVAKDQQPEVKFDLIKIQIGSKSWNVELAKTSEQHQKGMMYREKLSENEGMLFVFEDSSQLNFWMKNTYVDLSIAYIDKNKKIVDIQEMQATSPLAVAEPKTYPSAKPAMYALEMPKGWFKKNKIKVGSKIKIIENSK
jgi:uncharacterized protein